MLHTDLPTRSDILELAEEEFCVHRANSQGIVLAPQWVRTDCLPVKTAILRCAM